MSNSKLVCFSARVKPRVIVLLLLVALAAELEEDEESCIFNCGALEADSNFDLTRPYKCSEKLASK